MHLRGDPLSLFVLVVSVLLGACNVQDAAEAFAITTDKSAYVATCTDDSFLDCAFTVEATYHNRTDRTLYLHRCGPDSEQPIYGVPAADANEESAYSPIYGCVGHDNQIRVEPGGTRIDVLEIRGPNSFDGVTNEPFGVLEGAFRLSYDAYPCAEQGGCEVLPEKQHLSTPFKVTLTVQDTSDGGL